MPLDHRLPCHIISGYCININFLIRSNSVFKDGVVIQVVQVFVRIYFTSNVVTIRVTTFFFQAAKTLIVYK